MHDRFQCFLDHLLSMHLSYDSLVNQLNAYLKDHFNSLKAMTESYASEEILNDDEYYYITFTYLDAPIDLSKDLEVVVSMIYKQNDFYIEVSIFDIAYGEYTYQITQQETN